MSNQMTYEEETELTPFSAEEELAILQIALDRAPAKLEKLAAANGDAEAFVHLPAAAAAAFHLGRFAEAKAYAERCLALAPLFQENWNYGNAVHIGHTVLGLIALNDCEEATAIAELVDSGNTPGSPQLNTFGPTMQLAKALLRAGHVEPVLGYLNQCRAFWEMGSTWLNLWERKVREGFVPNFFQHSHV
jgi:tetratricopeptide (TPR) repeat protein